MHGAIAYAVAPPRPIVDKKTIEKSWKLMDKVRLVCGCTKYQKLPKACFQYRVGIRISVRVKDSVVGSLFFSI